MKVLFAVSNEEISESIVKKYQKEYKQIISYKNVYYFNAILKELQKDKTYDRIVISEDLEAFTHTQYDEIDKFIFDRMDSISDEASNIKGNDTPIIVICSDRRAKSESMLVKLFGIGIYNAIIGNDRSVDEVCKLINRPRTKKEAKNYYKIDVEDVSYQAENENDVSEMEIQNIIAHYKRLGKNEDRYVDSFNNIAAQYNDTQLRIITKFLPLNVRAVLEEKSAKYQQIMSFNNAVSDTLRKPKNDTDEEGPSEILLKSKNRDTILSKPVVIPSAVNMSGTKKLARHKQEEQEEQEVVPQVEQKKPEPKVVEKVEEQVPQEESNTPETVPVQPVKRGRGRPRKNPIPTEEPDKPKRGRGRPRKNPIPTEEPVIVEEVAEEIKEPAPFIQPIPEVQEQPTILPGFDDDIEDEDIVLPGLEMQEEIEEELISIQRPQQEQPEPFIPQQESNYTKFNETTEPQRSIIPEPEPEQEPMAYGINNYNIRSTASIKEQEENYEEIDLSNLLTPDKKIVTFVGTSKNGTSFIVNNVAELLSSIGINVAVLDTTQNRNSYYIYTKNEEALREVAAHSIERLSQGIANGISVNKNFTVYTSLPNEEDKINHVDKILETLLQKHSLILIDTDFKTPIRYFKQSQETYLVQSMDILTIQPLTAFLKELKIKNILDERKLRVVLNKTVKIKGIKDATIIGGMAFYNDPAMSFMTELFDRDRIKYVSIPFEEETYIRYLEGIIECEISQKGYSKAFMQTLRELGNMIYPIITSATPRNNKNYRPPSIQNNGGGSFSSSMNNTLNKMRGY